MVVIGEKTDERKKIRNLVVSDLSEFEDENFITPLLKPSARNRILSDSSESEDEGLMVKATEIGTGDKNNERKKVRNRIVSESSESEDEGKKILNMLYKKSF